MSDELKGLLGGLKNYIYMSRPCLDMHGRSYLGNNMVALIEQALDQNARDVAQEDEESRGHVNLDAPWPFGGLDQDHPDMMNLADLGDMYDERRDR